MLHFLVLLLLLLVCFAAFDRTHHMHHDKIARFIEDKRLQLFNYAKKMLKNRHIVFIGDSLMRYQYIDFIYFLHHGHFISMEMDPNPLTEHDWGGFDPDFFTGTSNLFYPYEFCDCFIMPSDTGPGSIYSENRFYRNVKKGFYVTLILVQNHDPRGTLISDASFQPMPNSRR